MENLEDTEINIDIDDIGTILKSSRLKSKKSLEEISSELCIRKIYLAALEEGDYETLPPIPYGIGYVRTYAKYLGLSPERAVKLYKAATVEENVEKPEEIEVIPEANKGNKWHIIAGLIALVLVCGIWSLCTRSSTPKEEEIIEQEEVIVEEAVDAEESAEKTAEEAKKDETKETAKPAAKEEVTKEDNKKPAQKSSINKNSITLVFNGDCWAKLQDKKKVYLERVYRKGDVKELPYTENLFLSVGVPANVKVYVKGVEKDILATKKKMNIPLDSLN